MIMRYTPCPEIMDLLLPAVQPCANFGADCAGVAIWDPENGHVPRGFVGALGELSDVELVLMTAEPGDPLPHERYEQPADPVELMESICRYSLEQFVAGTTLFHKNIRRILDSCWPQVTLEDQLRKTWFVDTYLCSARVEGGTVPAKSWRRCGIDYLGPQLRLLSDRAIVALGRKAQKRTQAAFDGKFLGVGSAAPPGCHWPGVRQSWETIPPYVRERSESGREHPPVSQPDR